MTQAWQDSNLPCCDLAIKQILETAAHPERAVPMTSLQMALPGVNSVH